MNFMVFTTQGEWDTTTLHGNNEEVLASQLFVELHAGRDEWGEPASGGINLGGEMTAIVRPQYDPMQEIGIFPGRIEMNFPGHQLVIENTHPMFLFETTRVWYNGRDVSDDVMEILVDFNFPEDIRRAFITIYRDRWIGSDEVATYNLLPF